MNTTFQGLILSGHGQPKVLEGEVLVMSEATKVTMKAPSRSRDYHELTLAFGIDQWLPIEDAKTIVLLLEFPNGTLEIERPLLPLDMHEPNTHLIDALVRAESSLAVRASQKDTVSCSGCGKHITLYDGEQKRNQVALEAVRGALAKARSEAPS